MKLRGYGNIVGLCSIILQIISRIIVLMIVENCFWSITIFWTLFQVFDFWEEKIWI